MAAYETYDYLRNAVIAELDNTAYRAQNNIGDGEINQVDRWIAESERAAYRQEITRNPAFEFISTQTLTPDPGTDEYDSRFFYPENFLEFRRVIAQVGQQKAPMLKISADILEDLPTDASTRIPTEFAELNRELITVPVQAETTVRMYYYGSLDPVSEVTDATTSHYLLNDLGEWLLYDACLRGGAYFRMAQEDLERWQYLRDEIAQGVYRQARRTESSGSTPRRSIPSQYTIQPRRRRGYF